MKNLDRFIAQLTTEYIALFATPEYAYAARRTDPAAMAVRMTNGLMSTPPTANKDGDGIKRTCKALGLPYTYKAIRAYLGELA
jgi:hypothetical protein